MSRISTVMPSLEGNHRVRNAKRAKARQKTCEDCNQPFIASDVRQRSCLECRAMQFRFKGVDGEGLEVECRQCDCKMYRQGRIIDACVCGHPKISVTGGLDSGHVHRYVLLGVGDQQVSNANGLEWEEVFEFLYSQYDERITYVGFFLSYDFIMWTRSMPWNKARQLWEKSGIDQRRYTNSAGIPKYHPVRISGRKLAKDVNLPIVQKRIRDGIISGDEPLVWEAHMHADRRLQLRPFICGCPGDHHVKMDKRKAHPTVDFMYINDTGGFFQTSFLNVIDPRKWDEPIVTSDEFSLIEEGKQTRANATLGPDMMRYNQLENEVLARVMGEYASGLASEGVNLSKRNWYGPGQAAHGWLNKEGAPKRKDLQEVVPGWFFDAARQSYFGGWFEIMVHGHVPGITWEYDINSAYPYIIAQLPCLEHGEYSQNKPETPHDGLPGCPSGAIQLIKAAVWGSDPYIGTMMHRALDNSILRPSSTRGMFWRHELEAAMRAGIVDRIECYEWMTYEPCDCFPPLRRVANLYLKRLDVGKNTPLGKGLKTTYNSMYGKMAQSVGEPPFANPIYASLITAGCRTMILEAIASHPQGTKAVAMVATDGVYFLTEHPSLPTSNKLGEWECKAKENMTLFKPGVYWDDKARQQIATGKSPEFKARGVNARDFATVIAEIDEEFAAWGDVLPARKSQWPSRTFQLGFSMVSAKQALTRGSAALNGKRGNQPPAIRTAKARWDLAGLVSVIHVTHSSWPGDKRMAVNYNGRLHQVCSMRELGDYDGRVFRSKPYELSPNGDGLPQLSKPYNKAFGSTSMYENGTLDPEEYGITPDGLVKDHWYEAMQVRA